MGSTQIELPEFHFCGLVARGLKKGSPEARTAIAHLWETFLAGALIEQIPEWTESIILTVYTDYDVAAGTFSAWVGCRIQDLGHTPAGLEPLTVPAQNYQMFLARGPMPDIVGEAWQQIDENSELDRAYGVDYDVYGPKSQQQQISEVEIFVSVA